MWSYLGHVSINNNSIYCFECFVLCASVLYDIEILKLFILTLIFSFL